MGELTLKYRGEGLIRINGLLLYENENPALPDHLIFGQADRKSGLLQCELTSKYLKLV